MALIIKKIVVGPLETNCYIVSCEVTGHTFVIDPGDSSKAITNYIYRNEFIPKLIILTHGHPDHIGGVKMIRGELGVSVAIHKLDEIEDVGRYLDESEFEKFRFIKPKGDSQGEKGIFPLEPDNLLWRGKGETAKRHAGENYVFPHEYLVDREILELGRERLTVIHTPGHTLGSVCFSGESILFSGDTLFKDGVGRTDLPGGSWEELESSLRNKIFVLPHDTIVYPGHGPETTIGDEISG